MSHKNIGLNSHKAVNNNKELSHNGKKITSSQHSRIKKSMADQLREEISILLVKQHEAGAETLRSYELYEIWKDKKNEAESELHYAYYRTWSDETRRLGTKIKVKLKAVQKYELRSNKMEVPKINDKKMEQYMKYGPSDEDE